jgi:hypothetical protein
MGIGSSVSRSIIERHGRLWARRMMMARGYVFILNSRPGA